MRMALMVHHPPVNVFTSVALLVSGATLSPDLPAPLSCSLRTRSLAAVPLPLSHYRPPPAECHSLRSNRVMMYLNWSGVSRRLHSGPRRVCWPLQIRPSGPTACYAGGMVVPLNWRGCGALPRWRRNRYGSPGAAGSCSEVLFVILWRPMQGW